MRQTASELYKMGQIAYNLGNPKEALGYFSKVLELEPDNKNALIKKGNIFGKLGKYTDAILSYDEALEQNPDDLLALVNKGLALHFMKQYDEAIQCYDNVLKIKPDNAVALYNKASSLVQKNNTAQAFEVLALAVRQDKTLKKMAKHDIDFQAVKHLDEFQRIVF